MEKDNYWTEVNPNLKNIYSDNIQTIKVFIKQVARQLKSFDHFIFIWRNIANFYLLPKHTLTWHFISQIFAGEKKLLKFDVIGYCVEMPKVRGIRIKHIQDQLKDINYSKNYFPDFPETDNIPRNYFFNVDL